MYDSLEVGYFFLVQQKQQSEHMVNQREGVLITDLAGVIRFINPAVSTITGYGEEIIGLSPRILKSGKHEPSFYREMWRAIEQEGHWQGEILNKRKNGELYTQWTMITRVNDDFDRPLYYAAVTIDITQRKKDEQQLRQLHDDLLLAREVQKGSLSKPIKNKQIHIEGVYIPSDMLGGDMYTWYPIDDHRYGVFLMDVVGHGAASALVCMSVRSLLKGIITQCIDPDQVLKEINQHVFSLFHSDDSLTKKNYYLTSMYAVIDTKEKTITYAVAGHPPGFLFDEQGQVIELDIGTVPLGMFAEIEVPTESHYYSPHTKLVFYTDGVMENDQRGTRENIEYLKEILCENQQLEADQLLDKTIETLLNQENFSGFQDDATLVAITLY